MLGELVYFVDGLLCGGVVAGERTPVITELFGCVYEHGEGGRGFYGGEYCACGGVCVFDAPYFLVLLVCSDGDFRGAPPFLGVCWFAHWFCPPGFVLVFMDNFSTSWWFPL